MKAVVVYDSAYGNTAKVAKAVADILEQRYETELLQVDSANEKDLKDIDMLVLGSPTQGGRATPAMQQYMQSLPQLRGIPVAVFDTRFTPREHGIPLRLIMRAVGFAAEKMTAVVTQKGGKLIGRPMGFIVRAKSGPLDYSEIERARVWAATILSQTTPWEHARPYSPPAT